MNINDIATADLGVNKMEINKTELSIYYDEVYFIPNKIYIKDIKINIKNWKEKVVKIYISETPFSTPQEVILNEQNIEPFDLIQEIINKNRDIILKGISSPSSYYMEYHIKECDFEVIILNK